MLGRIEPEFPRDVRDDNFRLLPSSLGRDHDHEVAPVVRVFRARGEAARIQVVGDVEDKADVLGLPGGMEASASGVQSRPDTPDVVGLPGVGSTEEDDRFAHLPLLYPM